MHRPLIARLLATALACLAVPQVLAAEEVNAREGLALQFIRTAGLVVGAENATVRDMESARILLDEAIVLEPDNLEVWHFARNLALVMEDEEKFAEATSRIAQLDPDDTVTRLQRISLALDKHQLVEERIAAYQRLLREENVSRLGPVVASRLWFDLAQWYRRRGDPQYADALAKAIEFDPSNRLAAAEAAGFFRSQVDDPVGEAELLTNLLLADPADLITQVALGVLLLEQGAYSAAHRIYQLAVDNCFASRLPPPDDLVADQVVAQWASGQPDLALRTIHIRQQLLDQIARDRAVQQDPESSPLEYRNVGGQVGPTLATVRAAIAAEQNSPNVHAELTRAIEAYRGRIAGENRPEPPPEAEIARLRLEMAWVLLWLGGDVADAQEQLEAAANLVTLTEEARHRFDGWIALRNGDLARATELLEPLSGSDAAAELGLARVYLQQGRRREGAQALLKVARMQPGSVIGVRAANELASLLGRRAALTDEARRLEELIDSIPSYVFRLPETPTLAVEINVASTKPVFEPYEPFIINVEISNNALFPLGIDRDGPIRPYVILYFETTFRRSGLRYELDPVVLDIARRLRLEPRQRLVVPVDLRRYPIAHLLNANVLSGTFVRVRALLNAVPNQGVLEPSRLGDEDRMRTARVEGVRLSTEWVTQATDSVAEAGAEADLRTLAILSHVIQQAVGDQAPPEQTQVLERAREALSEAFAKQDPIEQAWLLAVMPEGLLPEQVRSVAQRSEDRLVQLSYLLMQVTGPGDAMLDAAMRSEDESIRRLAEAYLSRPVPTEN